MLEVRQLCKQFRKKHGVVDAARAVSLSIADGEFVSITGPSGSGKSTLLLMLGGMSSPTAGTVLWNGQNIYRWGFTRRAQWRAENIGFVFQSFNLVPYLTVYENVSLALHISGRTTGSNGDGIAPLLESMGLGDRSQHLPNELSIGQQQRVALARALVKNPQIILADEPTGNLDRDTAAGVLNLLKNLNQQGKTVVLVTHDLEVAKLARRNVRIVNGCVQPDGTGIQDSHPVRSISS